jgi:fermentation-respiration switch protein FrsA (DUF1100 family)
VKSLTNGLLLFASTLLGSVLLYSCRFDEKFIFYPSPDIVETPHSVGLKFDDVTFFTRDGLRLHGWFVPHRQSQTTLIWFHGNAGNISHRLANIRLLHELAEVHVFIFDYRGYGRSEGEVSEEGTYLDGEAAVEYLRSARGTQTKGMVFFGRSLGAAVAAEMATRISPMALILESPFVSIREMARETFPYLPVGYLLRTKYDIVGKVRKVTSPVLVLHGDRDEIVPFSQGKKVFAVAPEPKQFYTIVGAGHNNTYSVGGLAYFRTIKEFIASAASRPG